MTIEDQSRVDIAEMRAFLERLREWQETPFEGDPMIDALLTYVTAAAHAIETLLTELEAARAAAERIAELEGALEPFAKCADEIDYDDKTRSEYADEPFVTSDDEWAKFRLLVSDYRRARAALQRKEPGA